MEFNIDKCVCMHLGTNNYKFYYSIGGIKLKNKEIEKDLGIIIDNNFKFLEQYCTAIKKADQILGIIKRKLKTRQKIL